MAGIMLIQGDALHIPLADKSVHACVCSPPYYGLRSYESVAPTCWPGGAYAPSPGAAPIVIPGPSAEEMVACAHVWDLAPRGKDSGSHHGKGPGSTLTGSHTRYDTLPAHCFIQGATCQRCACWQGTLGNEPTPQMFCWHLLLVFREIRRVLRDDGTFWCIIADSYSNGTVSHFASGSLLGIPWLVTHAAIADGWVVRNEAVFWKDAPMPESVKGGRYEKARCACLNPTRIYSGTQAQTNGRREHPHGGVTAMAATTPDPACPTCHGTGRLEEWVLRKGSWRHTRATESVFMLSKTMNYWSDGEAVREDAVMKPQRRSNGHSVCTYAPPGRQAPSRGDRGAKDTPGIDGPGGRNPRNTLREPRSAAANLRALVQWLQAEAPEVLDAYHEAQTNPGNVLRPQVSGHGLPHYASFPASLIEPLIKASVPAQCCAECGQGYAPFIIDTGRCNPTHKGSRFDIGKTGVNGLGRAQAGERTVKRSLGVYAPTCQCQSLLSPVPGLVLDPFAGTSTTAEVARALGRHSVMLDPSWPYIHDFSRERLGLTDLARWQGEAPPPPPETYDDLPLFAP